MFLSLFNPEHDLALACGEENYMPPVTVRQMAGDLALLPAWYAPQGSGVLAPSAYNATYLKEMQSQIPLDVQLVTEPEITSHKHLDIHPWGWNPVLCKRLSALGVEAGCLPGPDKLQNLRECSHRRQAVDLLPRLLRSRYRCGESFYLTHLDECQRFVEAHAACLLKAPLSGSGKGLNWCKGSYTPHISGWCKRITASQGGVVGEPIYNKVEDFAMEFYSDGTGGLAFAGHSLFHTGASGAYRENLLLPEAEIERRLSEYVPREELDSLRSCLQEELRKRFSTTYRGYLGVDMMVCLFEEEPCYRIHPCVEINLRMNMGVVARLLCDRYLAEGTEGVFKIDYYTTPGTALEEHRKMQMTHPLVAEGGKVFSGYLPLVPVTTHSRYSATVVCG